MITIIDYGVGNIGSIENILKYLNVGYFTTSNIDEIDKATKIILPGVGAFDTAMTKLHETGISEIIKKKSMEDKVPLLGICLGMQILAESSEEGKLNGLGLVKGTIKKFQTKNNFKIPHMGWNYVKVKKEVLPFHELENKLRFYFVHSYYFNLENTEDEWMSTNYIHSFTSAVNKNNIFGVQFHPEKSHKYGMMLFKEFSKL